MTSAPPPPAPAQDSPKRPLWVRWAARAARLALVLALLVVVFGASFYLTMQMVFTGREVTVPDLIGLPIDQARAAVDGLELYLQEDEARYDDAIEPGRIRSQDPPAGATIKKHRKVKVSVSRGRLEIAIPEVRGQRLRTARLALERQGLRLGQVTRTTEPGVAEDVIMAQDPAPSAQGEKDRAPSARADGAVDLLVSRGPEPVRFVMPDLTGRKAAEVNDFARRARLRVGPVRREPAFGRERGIVLKQAPEAGQPVGRNDIISLVLSE